VVLINHSVWADSASASLGTAESWVVALAERLWLGVPMFFVISGYCISATVDGLRRSEARPLSSYLMRRFRRIFPPYWFVLGATVVTVAVLDTTIAGYPLTVGSGEFLRPWWFSPWQWLGNLTLTEQWRMNVIGGQKAWFLTHAWTLAYEEQFYLVAAILLWLTPRRYFAFATLVSLAVAATALIGEARGWPIDGFFFDGSWLLFYLGAVVYYAINYGSSRTRWGSAGFFLLAAALIFLLAGDVWASGKSRSQSFLVALTFAAVLIGLHRFDRTMEGMAVLRPFQVAGLMCYSLYLVHLPINKLLHIGLTTLGATTSPWLTIPLCAAVSLPVAWWFHLAVERRFMAPSSVRDPRLSGAVALTT
jgi:peptidoglycan/LPS O-acetylase OafA/YrhL